MGLHHRRTENKKNPVCIFCFNLASCSVQLVSLFQLANVEADQNTENRVRFWPEGPTAETAAAIKKKTEVVGHTIETLYELIMIQIILFAPKAGNPFLPTQKPLHAEHN